MQPYLTTGMELPSASSFAGIDRSSLAMGLEYKRIVDRECRWTWKVVQLNGRIEFDSKWVMTTRFRSPVAMVVKGMN